MIGRGFRVGSLLGVDIRIDASWLVIFFLVLWSLSAGVFPRVLPDRGPALHLAMGIAGTLLFFGSLLAHELGHAWVAQRRGVEVEGITLFIFGGIAHTHLDSEDPADEMLIAGVGPLVSLLLGAAFLAIAWMGADAGLDAAVGQVALHVGWFNVVVAAFNLLPGFPLDGGRLFRAAAWKLTGDLNRATRWAVRGGTLIGSGLMVLGILQALAGAVVAGLWLVFIGWFLRSAAMASLREHQVQRYLQGVSVEDVMTPRPATVHPDTTLRELALGPLATTAQDTFPVTSYGALEGVVTLDEIARRPQERWHELSVREVMSPLDQGDAVLVVPPESSLSHVLTRAAGTSVRPVVVAQDGEVVGLLSIERLGRLIERARSLSPESPDPRAREPAGSGS